MRSLPLVLLLFAATSAAQVVPHHLTEADRPHATPPAIPRDAIHAPRVESLQRSRAMRTPVAPGWWAAALS